MTVFGEKPDWFEINYQDDGEYTVEEISYCPSPRFLEGFKGSGVITTSPDFLYALDQALYYAKQCTRPIKINTEEYDFWITPVTDKEQEMKDSVTHKGKKENATI